MLLLDEPFGALDAKVRKELRRWLRPLHDDIARHVDLRHPRPGRGAGSRRPRGGDGQGPIEQVGTPAEVYDKPGDRLRLRNSSANPTGELPVEEHT